MTENEARAIKWMKCVKDDAVATLDHIAKNAPNVSPMLYAGRKEKAETIINGFEELEQYREIGTVRECQEAVKKQKPEKPLNKTKVKTFNGKVFAVTGTCPACNSKLVLSTLKYCYICGQAIDRSVADETTT